MRRSNRSRGQAIVELALVLPAFVMLLLGVIDFGRSVWATTSLASAAREAARFAIVHGGASTNPCPVGPPGPDAVIPPASADCPYPSPSKQAIVDVATAAAIAGGSGVTVTVCYAPNDPAASCSGSTDYTPPGGSTLPAGSNARGMLVTVAISSQVNLVLPSLLGISSVNLTGTSTMVVNH